MWGDCATGVDGQLSAAKGLHHSRRGGGTSDDNSGECCSALYLTAKDVWRARGIAIFFGIHAAMLAESTPMARDRSDI